MLVDGDECTCQVPDGEEWSSTSLSSSSSMSSFSSFPTISFSTAKPTPARINSLAPSNSWTGTEFRQSLAKIGNKDGSGGYRSVKREGLVSGGKFGVGSGGRLGVSGWYHHGGRNHRGWE